MRSDITWYPGSPIATLQVLGAQEDETTISGRWKDRFLKESAQPGFGESPYAQLNGEPIANVQELAKLVDDMRRKGQMIDVTWFDIARRGIIKTFRQKWFYAQELEYEITFLWVSQAEALTDIEVTVKNEDLSDLPPLLQNDADFLNPQSLLQEAGAAIATITDTLNEHVDEIQSGIFALEDTVFAQVTLTLNAFDAIQRVAGILDFVKLRARNLQFVITDDVNASIENSDPVFGVGLKAFNVGRSQRVRSRSIASTAAQQQDVAVKRLNPELVSTVTARKNQDLRDVATRAYGTPDAWRALAQFNKMKGSKTEAGQMIFVPRDPPKERG